MTKVKKFLTRQKTKLHPGFLDSGKIKWNYNEDKQKEEEISNMIRVDLQKARLY
jgi:hypothetical protein